MKHNGRDLPRELPNLSVLLPLTCYTCQMGNSVCSTQQVNIARFMSKWKTEDEANLRSGFQEGKTIEMPSMFDQPANIQEDADHTVLEEEGDPEVSQLLIQLHLERQALRIEISQETPPINNYDSLERRLLSTPPHQLLKQDLGLLLKCIQHRALALLDASYLPSPEDATQLILLRLVLVAVPIESLYSYSTAELQRYSSFFIDACEPFRPDLNPNLTHRFAEISCLRQFVFDGRQYFGARNVTPDDVRAILKFVPISEYPSDFDEECSVCYLD